MQFVNTNNHKQVSLAEGLTALEKDTSKRLYSDGLEQNEYMYYDPHKGICYEDGCVIGHNAVAAIRTLIPSKWVLCHDFYLA